MTTPTTGRIEHLFLANDKGTPMTPVVVATALTDRGLKGDRHAKRPAGGKRQILLLDAASLDTLNLPPGTLKENVVISGLPLETYMPGQRLHLGPEVVVEIWETCVPCQKLNSIRPGLLKESWGNRGQLGKVVSGGSLTVGDTVTVGEINPLVPRKPVPRLPA